MALKGLVIDQPWIELILAGEKIWEMRSRSTRMRGPIALIEKGTGTVVGLAELADSLPALSRFEMQRTVAKHRIPTSLSAQPDFKWFSPWVLRNVRRLSVPVPYDHPAGAVIWVNLSPAEEQAVCQDLQSDNEGQASHRSDYGNASSAADKELAASTLSQIDQQLRLGIPPDATPYVKRIGNKLYIDVEWDDGLADREVRWPEWRQRLNECRDIIGFLGLIGTIISWIGATFHIPLAILVDGITFFGGFKWLAAMLVSMIFAHIGGRGNDLEEIFGKRPRRRH